MADHDITLNAKVKIDNPDEAKKVAKQIAKDSGYNDKRADNIAEGITNLNHYSKVLRVVTKQEKEVNSLLEERNRISDEYSKAQASVGADATQEQLSNVQALKTALDDISKQYDVESKKLESYTGKLDTMRDIANSQEFRKAAGTEFVEALRNADMDDEIQKMNGDLQQYKKVIDDVKEAESALQKAKDNYDTKSKVVSFEFGTENIADLTQEQIEKAKTTMLGKDGETSVYEEIIEPWMRAEKIMESANETLEQRRELYEALVRTIGDEKVAELEATKARESTSTSDNTAESATQMLGGKSAEETLKDDENVVDISKHIMESIKETLQEALAVMEKSKAEITGMDYSVLPEDTSRRGTVEEISEMATSASGLAQSAFDTKISSDLTDKQMSQLSAYETKLIELDAKLGESTTKMQTLEQEAKEFGASKVPTAEFQNLEKELTKDIAKLEELQAKMKAYLANGGDPTSAKFSGMQAQAEALSSSIYEKQEAMATLSASGGAFQYGKDTEQYASMIANVEKAKSSVLGLSANVEQTAFKMMTLKSTSKSTSKSFTDSFGKALSAIKGLFKGAQKTGDKFFKKFLMYGLGIRGIMGLIRKVRSAVIADLGKMAKSFPEVNAQMSAMKNAMTNIKNAAGTAFQPLLNILVPIMQKVSSVAITAANAVGSFFASLTGQKYIYKVVEAVDDYADSMGGAGKATNDALGAYDKLQVIGKDSGGGSGSGGGGGYVEGELDESGSNLAEMIKKAWTSNDVADSFKEVGKFIGDGLAKALDNIPWSTIQAKATKLAQAIGGSITGFFESDFPASLGRTVGNGLNTIVTTLDAFVVSINFQSVGSGITTSLTTAVKTINFKNIGKLASDLLCSAFDFGTGLIKGVDWKSVPSTIVDKIKDTLSGFDWKKAAGSLGTIGATFVKAMFDLGQGIGDIVTDLFNSVYDYFDKAIEDNWDDTKGFGENILNGILTGILDAIANIYTWVKTNIFQPIWDSIKKVFDIHSPSKKMAELGDMIIQGLIDGIKSLISNVGEWFVKIWDKIKEIFSADRIKTFWTNVVTWIGNTLHSVASKIKEKFLLAWDKMKEVFSLDRIKAVWERVVTWIGSTLHSVATKIKEKFLLAWDKMKEVFTWERIKAFWERVVTWIGNVFGAIKTKFKEKFESAWTTVKDVFTWEKIKSWFEKVVTWIGNTFGTIKSKFKEKFESAWTTVKDVFTWEKIKSWFEKVVTWASNGLSTFGTTVKTKFQSGWKSLTDIFSWTNITNLFNKVINWIGGVFSTIGNKFSGWFNSALTNIKNIFSWKNITDVFNKVWNAIQSPFRGLTNWFQNTFGNAWAAVKNVFSNGGISFEAIKEGVSSVFKGAVNHLIDGINTVISKPFSVINQGLAKLRDTKLLGKYPFSGISTITIPQIPKLAKGAVIPPNKEFLAMLGDQKKGTNIETPLDTMIQAFNKALDDRGGANNDIVLTLDGRVIARAVWDEEEKRYKQKK